MVAFEYIDVPNKSVTVYSPVKIPERLEKRFHRTGTNLSKMMYTGHPCKIVSPVRPLSDEDLEEYRKYFCAKAKKDKVNYIYFPVPVKIL